MSDLKDLPLIYLKSRNGDGYPRIPHTSQYFQEDMEAQYSSEPPLKEAFSQGTAIHAARRDDLAVKLKDRQQLKALSTEMHQKANEFSLKSLRDALQENILSLKELSEFSQNNKTAINMVNEEKSALLKNLEKAQSLGLLKVIPVQQKESDIKSPSLTSGEIKLHDSIDPSYLVTSRDRSKLHFMIMNNENSQSSSEAILRIFSDEGNHKNPFYHLNIEFSDALPQDKASINSLFRNNETVSDTSDDLLKKFQNEQYNRTLKSFQAENNILEYLFEHELGKAAQPNDNLNLLISINELLSAQKSEEGIRSGQIKSGEAFEGKPFYSNKLFNTSQKPLGFHTGFIKTDNLEIQFLILDNKESGTIPKLNLKLTDKMSGHSKSFLLDAEEVEKDPNFKISFQKEFQTFLSLITKKESKLTASLKRPDRPKS